jgi:Fe-Mn family superoxide dismutase
LPRGRPIARVLAPRRREVRRQTAEMTYGPSTPSLYSARDSPARDQGATTTGTKESPMTFTLPELPWTKESLAPLISAETIDYHYGKHHKTYVDNLNKFAAGTKYETMSLEEVVKASQGQASEKKIFNNSAQIWNHTFFWHSIAPKAGGNPTGAIAAAIDKAFGSFADFKTKFTDAAVGQFGSGWAWLVKNADGSLAIEATSNADTPFAVGKRCVLTIDVWEHAYYIDYRNARPKFVEAWWNLVNWDFANRNIA